MTTAMVALAIGAACKEESSGPSTQPGAQIDERAVPVEQSVREHMAEHGDKATEMRDAVALGALRELELPAQWMAEHLAETRVPAAWRPFLEDFRLAAQEAAATKDYAVAASAIGRMGAACATCHEKLGGPRPTIEPAPSDRERMQRHLYGTDLLWDGLTAPSEEAWAAGAEALALAPMTKEEIDNAANETTPANTQDLAKAIRSLGTKAKATARAERGAVYGEILKACSDCHRATGQEG